MDKKTYFDITRLTNESSNWESELLIDEVNICSYLQPESTPNFERNALMAHPTSYRFSSKYIGVSSHVLQNIKHDLTVSAIASGFKLILNRTTKATTKRLITIQMKCSCGRVYNGNKKDHISGSRVQESGTVMGKERRKHTGSKGRKSDPRKITFNQQPEKRRTSTSKSLHSQLLCPFEIKICCSRHDNRWYLLHDRRSCMNASIHYGHVQSQPEHTSSSTNILLKDQLKLVLDCNDLFMSSSAISNLLKQGSTTHQWLPKDLRNLSQKMRMSLSKTNSHLSSADNLINSFQEKEDVSFVMLTHVTGTGYIVENNRGRPKKNIDPSIIPISANELRKQLKISKSQKMLLAFAWSTIEEQRMANMFPEFIAFDVTSQTNKEKRDLFLAAGLDGNNKTFVPFHCFMPSGSQWVYKWIYDYAIPLLLGKSFTNRNKLALTDGDFCEYVPLEESISTTECWNNSTHGLCEYHFLFQAWMKDVSVFLKHVYNY